jgi:hypothetical protein
MEVIMLAHKLNVYNDPPFKKVVYCTVCGQDTDLSKPCPGEYLMTEKEKAVLDKQFREIFGKPVYKGIPVPNRYKPVRNF